MVVGRAAACHQELEHILTHLLHRHLLLRKDCLRSVFKRKLIVRIYSRCMFTPVGQIFRHQNLEA
jgi:hypothetical protein